MTNDEMLNWPFLLFMLEHKLLILMPAAITQQISAAERTSPHALNMYVCSVISGINGSSTPKYIFIIKY